MGLRQLSNAIYLLDEKEKDLNDDFDEDDLKDRHPTKKEKTTNKPLTN